MDMGSPFEISETRAEHRAARRWLGLALAVLVLAGVFALAVVVGRMPPFDRLVTDPLLFKRCLVAHVNLALVAWFYSFLIALLFLLPSRRTSGPIALHSAHVAAAGVTLMLIGAAAPFGRPLLSNYIPTIDNPLFQAGQLVFALGIVASLATRRWLPGVAGEEGPVAMPGASRAGLRAIALAFGLAALTFAISAMRLTPGLPGDVRHEFLVWGVGHALQLVSTIGMVTVWSILLTPVLGSAPVSGAAATALFASFVLPWTIAPLFALQGTESLAYRHGFTHLMRWCLFPVVSLFLLMCLGAVVRAWRAGRIGPSTLRDPRFSAFLVSVALTLLGFGLGAAIRGSNTMVPAHYHASVGAVTVAFMAATWVLLPAFRVPIAPGWPARAATWQSAVYGLGMLVFAGGFALAGAHGMGRKMYGAEQAARGAAETAGLVLMGVGGLLAIAGGILFLVIVALSFWRRGREASSARRSAPLIPAEAVPGEMPRLPGSTWRLPNEAR
jgi:hypothetical protein